MKDVLWKLATKQLKPNDWKKLAYHWHFTAEHVKAIEQEYTGTWNAKNSVHFPACIENLSKYKCIQVSEMFERFL